MHNKAHLIRRIAQLEALLEGMFTIPVLGKRVGLDGLIGLVPVLGDVVTGALALYPVHLARQLGAPRLMIARMLANVGFDTLIGFVPFAGDALDFMFSSSTRNLRLLRRWVDRQDWPDGPVDDALWTHPGAITLDAQGNIIDTPAGTANRRPLKDITPSG